MPRKLNMQAGFTLIELTMWMMLTVLILAALGGTISTSTRAWVRGDSNYDAQLTAGLVMDAMVKEFRYGRGFVVLSDYSDALRNEAIRYISLKPNEIEYTYYVNKSDRRLYRSWKNSDGNTITELVLGQISGIRIDAIDEEKPIFSLIHQDPSDPDSEAIGVEIVFRVKAKVDEYVTVQTTVTGVSSFLTDGNE